MRNVFLAAAGGFLALAFASPSWAEENALDPWATLAEVKNQLRADGPTRADFVHHYIPAGFPDGEVESGELSLALPDCLRWDYREPYGKSFLICGREAHFWVPEDGTGQRSMVDPQGEPGLDLLLLDTRQLATRYRATAETDDAGNIILDLEPDEMATVLIGARFVIDSRTDRLLEVSYEDREGGSTRFEISGYGPLEKGGQFTPPESILWQEP
ncbi:MAG: outer membrane lipoprotein carrier protein LolA [Acidobacteriota bacterium]